MIIKAGTSGNVMKSQVILENEIRILLKLVKREFHEDLFIPQGKYICNL